MTLRRKLLKKTPTQTLIVGYLTRRQHRMYKAGTDMLRERGGPARGLLFAHVWDPGAKKEVRATVRSLMDSLRRYSTEEITKIEKQASDFLNTCVGQKAPPSVKAWRGHQFAMAGAPDWLRLLTKLAGTWHETPGKLRESRRIVRSLRKAGAVELIPVCCRPRIRKKNLAST